MHELEHSIGDKVPTPLGHSLSIVAMSRIGVCSDCVFHNDKNLCYKLDKNSILGPCLATDRSDGNRIYWHIISPRDRKIGEVFRPYRGRVNLKVEYSTTGIDRCIGCHYYSKSYKSESCNNVLGLGECSSDKRIDKRNVIFVRDKKSEVVKGDVLVFNKAKLKNTLCSLCPYGMESDECQNSSLCMYNIIIKDQLK